MSPLAPRMAVPCAKLALLALCSWPWAAAAESRSPACRKSPELHALSMREAGRSRFEVVAFGGKGEGFRTVRRRRDDFRSEAAFFGDTWVYSVHSQRWSKVEFGRRAEKPSARWKPESTTFDGASRMALFGGCATTEASGVLNDLWVLHLASPSEGSWMRVRTENPPEARRGHIVVANKTHLLVVGGKGWTPRDGAQVYRDLWALPLEALRGFSSEAGVWSKGTPFPGRPRWGATGELLELGDGRQALALFGGRDKRGRGYIYYNELWLYHFASDEWELVQPEGPLPHARDHHGAAASGSTLFVFGGRTCARQSRRCNRNDLWSYSAETNRWTLHGPKRGGEPKPRFMPGVTVRQNNRGLSVVVFAGQALPGSTKRTSLNDLWAYDLSPEAERPWREVSRDRCSAEDTLMELDEADQDLGPGPQAGILGLLTFFLSFVLFGFLASFLLLARPRWLRCSLKAGSEPLLQGEGPGSKESGEGFVNIVA